MKSKISKKLNRKVKNFNKKLSEDVFGNRFWLRQVKKIKHGYNEYFLYELKDRKQPQRDRTIRGWINIYETDLMLESQKLWNEMNNFIIESDFWQVYMSERRQNEL